MSERLLPLVLGVLALAGCEANDPAQAPDAPPPAAGSTVTLTDDSNFSYEADLQIVLYNLQPYADVEIRWDGLTEDVRGNPMDPTDVEQVVLLVFLTLAPGEIQTQLIHDTIQQSDIGLYQQCTPDGATACRFSEFELFGSNLDIAQYFEPTNGTWLLVMMNEESAGGMSFVFLVADEQSDDTEVDVDEDTAQLDIEVDLRQLTQVEVRRDADMSVDWSGVGHDGLGLDLPLYKLDELEVGRYLGLDISDLQQNFLQLESLATERFTADIAERQQIPLKELTLDGTGDRLTDLDPADIWLMALRCSTCDHPMPKIVTLLRPME